MKIFLYFLDKIFQFSASKVGLNNYLHSNHLFTIDSTQQPPLQELLLTQQVRTMSREGTQHTITATWVPWQCHNHGNRDNNAVFQIEFTILTCLYKEWALILKVQVNVHNCWHERNLNFLKSNLMWHRTLLTQFIQMQYLTYGSCEQ